MSRSATFKIANFGNTWKDDYSCFPVIGTSLIFLSCVTMCISFVMKMHSEDFLVFVLQILFFFW